MTTYEVYLQSALVGSLFQESEAVAEKLISMKDATPQVRWLAQLVNVIGEVDRGAFDQALESVRNAVKLARAAEDRGSPLPAETRVSLIDHFVHRVVQAGRFDIASEALAAIATISDSPDVKETVANWQARIALVGKPAPALAGTDVDGRPYRLADQKGHVVLVWFWATWCVPNAQEMAQFVAFEKRHRAEGLRVVGVNLDALQADARDRADVRAHVKKSLLDQNCPWPNLLCGEGADDHCKAFAVRSIPANYLVGRDGTIVQLDLVPANAEVAIEKALATGASR
jgi:thiol-disulfide isomerase/thioredoxin